MSLITMYFCLMISYLVFVVVWGIKIFLIDPKKNIISKPEKISYQRSFYPESSKLNHFSLIQKSDGELILFFYFQGKEDPFLVTSEMMEFPGEVAEHG